MDSLLAHPFATSLEQLQLRFSFASLPINLLLAILVILTTRFFVKVSPYEFLCR
jgi:hypothetical protein